MLSKPRLRKTYLYLLIPLLLSACTHDDIPEFPEGEVEGYIPVYLSDEELKDIRMRDTIPLKSPGKLLLVGKYLLINEKEEGLHVIDNEDPSNPVKIAFLQIPGNIDIAVKGEYIYADNFSDLVTIRILSDSTVEETSRIKNVFPRTDFPTDLNGYFECVDPSKGAVIGWQITKITNPKCYR